MKSTALLWRGKIKEKIRNLDLFELGPFVVAIYLLVFFFKPFLIFISFIFGFNYSWFVYGSGTSSSETIYLALFYLLLGLVFLILGYFNRLPKLFAKKLPNILRKEWNFETVPWVFGICFSVGILTKLLRILGGAYYALGRLPLLTDSLWYGLVGYLDWLSYIALAIAFVSYFSLKKNGDSHFLLWRRVAWGCFIVEIIYAVPMCGRSEWIIPITIYLITRYYLSSIKWRHIFIAGLVIVFFVIPYGNVCRLPVPILEQYSVIKERLAPVEKPIVPIGAVTQVKSINKYNINPQNISGLIFDSFFSRVDLSIIFLKIVGEKTPFYNHKSILNFFIALPPRFIWKDKPVVVADGNALGHYLGLIPPDDKISYVQTTIVGDWYMNFGIAGIIFGMLFMGFLWRIFYEYLIKGTSLSLSGVLIYSIVFIIVSKGIESDIASVYAGLTKFLVILFLVHFFLTRDTKEKAETLSIS